MERQQLIELKKKFWADFKSGLDFSTLSSKYNLQSFSQQEREFILEEQKFTFKKKYVVIGITLLICAVFLVIILSSPRFIEMYQRSSQIAQVENAVNELQTPTTNYIAQQDRIEKAFSNNKIEDIKDLLSKESYSFLQKFDVIKFSIASDKQHVASDPFAPNNVFGYGESFAKLRGKYSQVFGKFILQEKGTTKKYEGIALMFLGFDKVFIGDLYLIEGQLFDSKSEDLASANVTGFDDFFKNKLIFTRETLSPETISSKNAEVYEENKPICSNVPIEHGMRMLWVYDEKYKEIPTKTVPQLNISCNIFGNQSRTYSKVYTITFDAGARAYLYSADKDFPLPRPN